MASSRRPGSPSAGVASRVSNSWSSSARRAAAQAVSDSGEALTGGRLSFFDLEGRGPAGREQRLDLLLGAVEDHGPAAAQLHTLLEGAQAVFEREVSTLQPLDDSAQPAEDVLEAFGRRFGL